MKFEFLENGVCTNPETPFQVSKGKDRAEIRICELNGKWTWAKSFCCGHAGRTGACSFGYPKTLYDSREEVINIAVKTMLSYDDWQKGGNYEWHADQLRQWDLSRQQIELF